MKVKPLNLPLTILIEAVVNPSEDSDKVKIAIQNLVEPVKPDFSQEDRMLKASTKEEKSLYHIYEQLRAKQTLAVARRILLEHTTGDGTWLIFNKQAAFVGVVNICEDERESPLGPIMLTIKSPYIGKFIDWLAPS
ncbi:MAG: hypothetical protein HXX80_00190 [Nitrososphaerales archaeon]|nr:hypothetical protein [Nitrososphaerales archaeon]